MTFRTTYVPMTNSNRFSRFANHFVPTQIVFIDAGVEDLQLLVNGVIPGIETVVLNSDRNGIEQITEVLNQKPYSTVHIVSHGSPGCLYLGNSQLSLDTLNKYQQNLADLVFLLILYPLSFMRSGIL